MDEFEEYYKNSEWFGTYQSDLMMEEAFEAGQQSMQAKVEELQNDVSIMLNSHKRMSVGLLQQQSMIEELIKERDELQKRVDAALKIIESYTGRKPSEKYDVDTEIDTIYDAEQALKGEG